MKQTSDDTGKTYGNVKRNNVRKGADAKKRRQQGAADRAEAKKAA